MILIKNTQPAYSDFVLRVQTHDTKRVLYGGHSWNIDPAPGEKISITPLFSPPKKGAPS